MAMNIPDEFEVGLRCFDCGVGFEGTAGDPVLCKVCAKKGKSSLPVSEYGEL